MCHSNVCDGRAVVEDELTETGKVFGDGLKTGVVEQRTCQLETLEKRRRFEEIRETDAAKRETRIE